MAKQKQQRPTDEFGIAESLGDIRTMPEQVEKPVEKVEELEVIDDPSTFRMAIGHAQMEGLDSIEVGEKLFKYLVKNSKTNYITYGDPGVKVYLAGTREQLEKEDKMNAEDYAIMVGKRKQQELASND